MTNLDSIVKSRDITLLTKIRIVKAMVFPVVMYGCESWDHKEGWTPKNQCFETVVLKKTLENPLDWKEIKPVTPKGNQLWILIGKTDAEAKAPILWPPDAKSCFIGKDLDAGKDWGQEKGAAEDKMVGWHHRLNEHESLDLNLLEKTQGDCEGQGSLACCSYGTWVGHWKTITIEYSMLYLYYL